jgi:hypothetical protein
MSALHFLDTFPSNSLNTALSPAVETFSKNIVVDENNIFKDETRCIIYDFAYIRSCK